MEANVSVVIIFIDVLSREKRSYFRLHFHSMQFDLLGLDPRDKVYDIKPKPKGDLPFDFEGSGGIDLIVAQKGLSASDLLDGFDLDICKAAFDGKKFHIPDPHLTFASKTKMEPNRRAVIESYVRHHRESGGPRRDPIVASRLTNATISAVRRDVPNTPFYERLDISDRISDRYNPNASFWDTGSPRGTLQDPMVQMKHGARIQFHNWCCKLINRLRKYQKRGIEVVDAPTIAEDFHIKEYKPSFFAQ